ncbi:hypothetical protein HZA85_00580 [Candidatus Uhrbacteria bacterium]|nr:hypothetical protein [Candidatus Uhrbacteria bacterium]
METPTHRPEIKMSTLDQLLRAVHDFADQHGYPGTMAFILALQAGKVDEQTAKTYKRLMDQLQSAAEEAAHLKAA